MAQSLEDARGKILTSVHGRRLGIDHTERLAGVKGIRRVVTAATSDTTGTVLPNHGICSVVTTTDDSWTLTDPDVGCEVTIVTGSSSTGLHTITCVAATVNSSASSTGPGVVLSGGNAGITLVGLTTALWAVTATRGTTLQAHASSA